jgi:hypothetical protein
MTAGWNGTKRSSGRGEWRKIKGSLSWKREHLEWTVSMGGMPILIDKINNLKQQNGSRNVEAG